MTQKPALKLTTWNINSVRLRLPLAAKLLREHAPDILCLQETKCRDAEFPFSAFRDLGYAHIEVSGQKGYHGVATISKLPLSEPVRRDFCEKGDARHLSVSALVGDERIDIHNFYIPAGGDEPDITINDKFAHKLAFLDELAHWIATEKVAGRPAILVGDLNVAPLELDVWSHKALLNVVSHTPIEVEKLKAAIAAGPWTDALRHFVPETERLYTWWSYRSPDWKKNDRGRRLDHIWTSAALKPKLQSMTVLREARDWERPSDHVPVSIILNA